MTPTQAVFFASLVATTAMSAAPVFAKDMPVVAATVSKVEGSAAARFLEWSVTPEGTPVSLSVATSASTTGQPLKTDTMSGRYVYLGDTNARRYFTVTPEGGSAVTTALRVLPLEGSRNFRDLGGYKTADGRSVKWGMIYRSGVMHDLTDSAYNFIDDLGIKTVMDFRSNEERENEPTRWRGGEDTAFISWDYSTSASTSVLATLFKKADLVPADVTAAMAALYGDMIYQHDGKYAALFEQLLSTDKPLAFHCSAGKDRTGIGAALVLTALGVDRQTVIDDYAMTERVVDYESRLASDEATDEDSPYAFLMKLPKDLLRPLMRSDPVYIKAAMARMEKDYGSVLGYIEKGLGVDQTELAALQDRLLE